MKRALRDKWAAALEGGKFTQGDGCLRNHNNECCCLGVLADVFDPSRWIKSKGSFSWAYGCQPYHGTGTLSDGVLAEVGLTEAQQREFVHLNDDRHKSFAHIAKVVRKLPVEDFPMKKFRVTVKRSAVTVLTYTVEAEDEDAAEAIVEAAIDSNALSSLGAPTEVLYE